MKSGYQNEYLINLHIPPMLGKFKLKDLNVQVLNKFYERLVEKGVGVSNMRLFI